MKAVILAGGHGTRLSEETNLRPKPSVEIGGKPILWHIMKLYDYHGITDFVICLGYKGYVIKEYFYNYFLYNNDVTIDLEKGSIEIHDKDELKWKITFAETGLNTMTGGRIKRVKDYIGDETFCLTYGDGVSNVDIKELIKFHKSKNVLATLTAVNPRGRFGVLDIDGDIITNFKEKPKVEEGWINGGFFVLEPEIFNYIDGDSTIWENEPLEKLCSMNQLAAYKHLGFWYPMDTLKDKNILQELWESGKAEWKVW
ncbi:MAG: glucose-1-phosphate cytidylyltransferase [Clostridium sp.]